MNGTTLLVVQLFDLSLRREQDCSSRRNHGPTRFECLFPADRRDPRPPTGNPLNIFAFSEGIESRAAQRRWLNRGPRVTSQPPSVMKDSSDHHIRMRTEPSCRTINFRDQARGRGSFKVSRDRDRREAQNLGRSEEIVHQPQPRTHAANSETCLEEPTRESEVESQHTSQAFGLFPPACA